MRQILTENGLGFTGGSWIILAFVIIFLGLILNVFRKKTQEKYAKIERLPLDD